MKMHSIKSKIVLAACLLTSLLLLQSYLFNYSQKSLLNTQKIQHSALMQSENVTDLENDVVSLQGQAIAYVNHANENTIEKFNFYLKKANLSLSKLNMNASSHTSSYQEELKRLKEYLNNYQETFSQVVINRTKREQLYITQFKQPIAELKAHIISLDTSTKNEKKAFYTNILLTISNLEHATVSYLYKPNFDNAQNVKQNLEHLHLKLSSISKESNSLISHTTQLKQAYNQLVLLTRSYTFSINVVLTGIENELLYLANQIKDAEKSKLDEAEKSLSSHLITNAEQANLLAVLITVILIVVSYFIFNKVIKPITQLTALLNDMNNEKPVILDYESNNQSEIASAIKAANALYTKNKQTKELLIETQGLNIQMEAMNKELTIAITQAEKANQIKGDFVANMSHELRTPMNGVLGMLQLLKDSSLPTKQQHYADKAFSSAHNLLHILNNILDFSKLDSEEVKIESIPFTLDSIVNNTANLFQDTANQKGLALEFNLHADPHLELIGDPFYLNQIINNCVGNAIKFTDHGKIQLIIETISQQKNIINLRFCIKDTGVGIKQEQLEKVFNSFYQGDASTTRKYGGTGLGLTISQQFAKVLGGYIQVRSEMNKGSEFYFTLPFTLPPQHKSKKRALLIAPKKEQVTKLITLLSDINITPETTKEPLRALAKISQPHSPFDIVILSLTQDEAKSSIILHKLIESSQAFEHALKIIVIITDTEQPILQEIHKDVHVIAKHYNDSDILKLLSPQKTITIAKDKAFNKFKGCKALIVDDNPLNVEITTAMLKKLEVDSVAALNGLEAIECIKKETFNIILMDIQMPVMDGISATKKLRESGEILPIIALTAAVLPEDEKAAITAGMNDFLAKPLIFDTFYEVINKHLSTNKEQSLINVSLALKNLEGNEHLFNKLLLQFSTDYEDFITKCQEFLDTNNNIDLVRYIHTIKGLAGTLGLENLEHNAKKIESQIKNKDVISFAQLGKQLAITFQAIEQYLLTQQIHSDNSLDTNAALNDVIEEIYELAINAKPIPNSLLSNLDNLPFEPPHPILGLKSAINHFNYQLVIELITKFRERDLN